MTGLRSLQPCFTHLRIGSSDHRTMNLVIMIRRIKKAITRDERQEKKEAKEFENAIHKLDEAINGLSHAIEKNKHHV